MMLGQATLQIVKKTLAQVGRILFHPGSGGLCQNCVQGKLINIDAEGLVLRGCSHISFGCDVG